MNQKSEHLTYELLDAFYNNTLDEDTYLKVLSHISSCEECSTLFSDSFPTKDLIHAPHYLKSSIMEELHPKEKSPINHQLFFYSLKVGLAMCGALIFLYSGLLNKDTDQRFREIPMVKMDTVDSFNNKLYEFSNKLMKEDNYYDQEKK